MGDFKLTLHVHQGQCQRLGIAKNIVHNDVGICILVNDDAMLVHQILPHTVEVVDEGNEHGWAVNWAEQHYVVRPFCGIRSSKRELVLGAWRDANLVVSQWCIPQPYPLTVAKSKVDCRIASGYQIYDGARDLVQRNIINAKSPYKVSNISDVFLMGFWRKEGFKLPLAVVHLTDVANFFQRRNTLAHNRSLVRLVVDLFNADRACSASVDNALVILDGDKLSFIVKNGPIFLEQLIDLLLNTRGEVQEIDEPAQNCSMSCLVVWDEKTGINLIDRRSWVLAFAHDCASVNVVEDHVELMRLIGITPVIVESILTFLVTYPGSYANQFGACIGGKREGQLGNGRQS